MCQALKIFTIFLPLGHFGQRVLRSSASVCLSVCLSICLSVHTFQTSISWRMLAIREWLIYQNSGHIGGLLTMKEFFRLDHFWGKIAFLKKKLSWVDLKEGIELEPWNLVGWSDILGAPDYWRKIHGSMIFVKIMAVFQKNWTSFLFK